MLLQGQPNTKKYKGIFCIGICASFLWIWVVPGHCPNEFLWVCTSFWIVFNHPEFEKRDRKPSISVSGLRTLGVWCNEGCFLVINSTSCWLESLNDQDLHHLGTLYCHFVKRFMYQAVVKGPFVVTGLGVTKLLKITKKKCSRSIHIYLKNMK